MHCNDRTVITQPSINKSRHDLVALRIKSPFTSWLRHTVSELTAAEILILRHRNLLQRNHVCVGWVLPIDMKLPGIDRVSLQNLVELRAASRHHDVRRAPWRKFLAVEVSVVQK